MKAYALFQEYIWLVNTIHRFGRLTLEEINQRWLDTELSEGIPVARSTFNRHRDAILDMFGIIIECDRKDGFRYYIFNEEVLEEDTIQNWMLSTLSVNSILSESKAVQKRILLESIPSDGDNLHKFIDAMKRGVRVKVNYRRYGAEASMSAMKLDPYFRKNNHHALTFAMSYNSSENYILPLSHDEVVHLKCSMVEKMPGYQVDKYANLRVGYTFMFGHCGKKLLFMGQDFGQEREWSEARELDWYLLGETLNKGMHDYMRDLLSLYRANKCMYECDNDWGGFEWINADDADRSTYSFMRKTLDGKKRLLFVLNMTPILRERYTVGVPTSKKAKLLLNSDDKIYGGNGHGVAKSITPKLSPCDNRDYMLTFDLAPFTALVFEI